MRNWLLSVLVFMAFPAVAELYKCTAGTKIAYQDKPCQTSQTQTIIPVVIKPFQPAQLSGEKIKIVRDADGKIKRSQKMKKAFKKRHPCPANGHRSGVCPGYVIDHIKPLACGGADSPENMQWQTVEAGKEKDRWERKECTRQL